MIKNKRTIQINFLLTHFQKDEDGNVETLFFVDQAGSTISLNYDSNVDYSQGISITIEEARYKLLRGRFISSDACEKISSIASNSEINSEIDEMVDEVIVEPQIETPTQFVQPKNELNIMFKLIFVKKSRDRNTNEDVKILKYADPVENVVYITEHEYRELFQREDDVKYVIFTISREDLQRDYRRTLQKYPDSRTTNISSRSIRNGVALDPREYDYRILDEIVEGQRRGDENYNTSNILELYRSVLEFREQERRKIQESQQQINYEFSIPSQVTTNKTVEEITEVEVVEAAEERKVDGRKAGAQRRWENIRLQEQKIQDLELRIAQLEAELTKSISINTQLEGLIMEQRRVLDLLRSENAEYKKMEMKYNQLKDIVDGEDPNYIISIHKIS